MSKQSRRTANSPKGIRHRYREGTSLVQRRGAVNEANLGASGSQEAVGTGDGGALRIIVEPTGSGRKWIARLGERVLCVAAAPFIQSVRILLSEGYHPDAVIEMWRPGAQGMGAPRSHRRSCSYPHGRGDPVASAKNGSPAREDAPARVPQQDNTRGPLGGPFLARTMTLEVISAPMLRHPATAKNSRAGALKTRGQPHGPRSCDTTCDLRLAPRCGAKTRSGTPCQRPAMRGQKRCRLHGGLSPGAPRGVKNGNFRNGDWTADAVAERRWLRSLLQSFAK